MSISNLLWIRLCVEIQQVGYATMQYKLCATQMQHRTRNSRTGNKAVGRV